ncbi:MAG: hypothetical protein R3D78_13710 [Paracoccaceae bacterium]
MPCLPVRLAAKSVAGKGEPDDWLASVTQAKTDTQPVLASATPVGHGSWVCSPTGFGASRCTALNHDRIDSEGEAAGLALSL